MCFPLANTCMALKHFDIKESLYENNCHYFFSNSDLCITVMMDIYVPH